MDGWNTTFLLGRPIFRGYVSFREGKEVSVDSLIFFPKVWCCLQALMMVGTVQGRSETKPGFHQETGFSQIPPSVLFEHKFSKMDVSKNSGKTPKSSILIGFSGFPLFSPSILGFSPLFLETPQVFSYILQGWWDLGSAVSL